jgi:hypothetical protein
MLKNTNLILLRVVYIAIAHSSLSLALEESIPFDIRKIIEL